MTVMTQRLRRDWFHHYLIDPQVYRPGTRMPVAWPQGRVCCPRSSKEHEPADRGDLAIPGRRQASRRAPYGLGREPIPLVADREPLIYRSFIQGAGPRGIEWAIREAQPRVRRQRNAARDDLARGVHRRLAALVGPSAGFQAPARRQCLESARGSKFRGAGASPNPGRPRLPKAWDTSSAAIDSTPRGVPRFFMISSRFRLPTSPSQAPRARRPPYDEP